MKPDRRFLVGWWLGACLSSAAAAACPEPTPLNPENALVAKDRGFLWQIEKGGHRSYLYGTAHVLKNQWTYPGPRTRRAIETSGVIAVEYVVADKDTGRNTGGDSGNDVGNGSGNAADNVAGNDRHGDNVRDNNNTAGDDLRDTASQPSAQHDQPPVAYSRALPAPLLQRIDRLAAGSCLSIDELQAFPPEGRIHALIKGREKQAGLHAEYGFDDRLVAYARTHKKPLQSLEDRRSARSPYRPEPTRADFLAALQRAVADYDNPSVIAARLKITEAWANSDAAALATFPRWCQCMRNAREIAFYKRLIDDRNLTMADGLDKIHQRGKPVFAGAGALHMFGANALPKLMARRGYRVERVF